eukprot:TRINITY_DN11862_c0_g3_i1.p1 TRINITY_DN11862_c0_g3~~TRINITY_DN11862_c0_g3_i1.p1  ORF type:complete len:388 (+),score=33.62 TRINITY_DN11862_c0_g3_i1:36-1199(+)
MPHLGNASEARAARFIAEFKEFRQTPAGQYLDPIDDADDHLGHHVLPLREEPTPQNKFKCAKCHAKFDTAALLCSHDMFLCDDLHSIDIIAQQIVDSVDALHRQPLSEDETQEYLEYVKSKVGIPADCAVPEYIRSNTPDWHQPELETRDDNGSFSLWDYFIFYSAIMIIGQITLSAFETMISCIFFNHSIDHPDEEYSVPHPFDPNLYTQSYYTLYKICNGKECGNLCAAADVNGPCESCGGQFSKRVWIASITNWLKSLRAMKIPMTRRPKVGEWLQDILDGAKYDETELGHMIDHGYIPYMVHGDGVQVMKRTLNGMFVLHATNLLIPPAMRMKRAVTLPYIVCEGPSEPCMDGIIAYITAEALMLREDQAAVLCTTPGDMPAA